MRPTETVKQGTKRLYEAVGRTYLTPTLRREAAQSGGREVNEGAPQYAFALRVLMRVSAHEVLDVGTGLSSWPRLLADCGFQVTAVDEFTNYWGARRPFNRHYLIREDDITNSGIARQFDAVTCLNVMMAVTDDRAAIAGMLGLLRPGGTLILSFPYNENHSVENAYGLPNSEYGRDYRFACRIYSRAHIDGWLREHRGEAIEQDYFQLFSGEFWTVGDRVMPRRVSEEEAHQFTALAMRKTG